MYVARHCFPAICLFAHLLASSVGQKVAVDFHEIREIGRLRSSEKMLTFRMVKPLNSQLKPIGRRFDLWPFRC